MRLLLDTHVVLWWLSDDPTLPDDLKSVIDSDPDVYLSPISVWEIAIKQASGKLEAPEDIAGRAARGGFKEYPLTAAHAVAAGLLPMIHRDPFDRMLVAQAVAGGMTLVTRDRDIGKYDVDVLPV